MDDFNAELLVRLPLAEAVLMMLSHVLDPQSLGRLFEEHRGRCYERELSLASMVGLIRDALLLHKGSGRQSFKRAQQDERLEVAVQSVYGKLRRMPLAVSQALLMHAAQRLEPLMCQDNAVSIPASLQSFRVIVLDGKTLKKVQRRLKLMRRLRAQLLGGQLAVAMDLASGMAIGFCASTNGEANEVPLSRKLMEQLRPTLKGNVLWMADRQYCDLGLPALFTRDNGHFLVRYSYNVGFHPDKSRTRESTDRQGNRVKEQWGWIGGEKDKRRREVRHITLYQNGKDPVELITDLLDAAAYPATDLLDLYHQRWGIERMFQQVTEVFSLQRLIGATPKATVFQASLCFVLYNMIQVIRGHVAAEANRKVEEVSSENLFTDVTRHLTAWSVLETSGSTGILAELRTPVQVKARLKQLLKGSWTPLWLKSKLQPGREKKHPDIKVRGGCISVDRASRIYAEQGS